MNFREIISKFNIEGDVLNVKAFGNGHINETYIVKTTSKPYILQNVNTSVFKNYVGVMDNIAKVTSFLKSNSLTGNGLYLIKTKGSKNYYYESGRCYRMMNYIDNSIVYQQTDDVSILQEAGFGLGQFISSLNDFDASSLVEVIPSFHDTRLRFENFKKSISEDKAYRVKDVQDDIKFVLDRENITSLIVDKIANKEIPLRVTHNDTKLNNFMFDKDTKKFRCLIDLDTIMPGSLLYDFGDAVRIACSTAGEEERDLTKVKFSLQAYEAFLKGFLSGIGDKITITEAKMLHIGAKIMAFEIGMRFLADYLDGDVYFKINEEDMNLVRARTQLKMVYEIEQKEKEMENILYKYYNSI